MSWVEGGSFIGGGTDSPNSSAISNDGLTYATAYESGGRGVRVYVYSGGSWQNKGDPIADDISGSSFFGFAVSLSSDGNRLAIGGPTWDSNRGYVNTYTFSSGAWNLDTTLYGDISGAQYGRIAALSQDGQTLIVSAPYSDQNGPNSGTVYVYRWSGSAWVPYGNLFKDNVGATIGAGPSGSVTGQYIGTSGEYAGNTVTVNADGEYFAFSSTTQVFTFQYRGSWDQRGSTLTNTDNNIQGIRMTPNGMILAVGGYNNNVTVYSFDGDWTSRGTASATGGDGLINIGWAIQLSNDGSILACGTPYWGGSLGVVFEYSGSAYVQKGAVIRTSPSPEGTCQNISLSGDGTVLIGANYYQGFSFVYTYDANPPGPGPSGICFLGETRIQTPGGEKRIDSLNKGDKVITADGRSVSIVNVHARIVYPSKSNNPYVVKMGTLGAISDFSISPQHRVLVKGKGLMEAQHLGLEQMDMKKPWTYYNLELPNWETDTLLVHGVEVESLPPIKQIKMSIYTFAALLKEQYGEQGVPEPIARKLLESLRADRDGNVIVKAQKVQKKSL